MTNELLLLFIIMSLFLAFSEIMRYSREKPILEHIQVLDQKVSEVLSARSHNSSRT